MSQGSNPSNATMWLIQGCHIFDVVGVLDQRLWLRRAPACVAELKEACAELLVRIDDSINRIRIVPLRPDPFSKEVAFTKIEDETP